MQQPQCMFESPVKQSQSQSLEAARQQVAIMFIVFLLILTRGCDMSRSANAISQIFPTPLSFSVLIRGDPLRIYGKASRILKLESSGQLTVKNLVILACTVLTDPPVWQTDRQTDRKTELQWLRCTTAVTAVACKNDYVKNTTRVTY